MPTIIDNDFSSNFAPFTLIGCPEPRADIGVVGGLLRHVSGLGDPPAHTCGVWATFEPVRDAVSIFATRVRIVAQAALGVVALLEVGEIGQFAQGEDGDWHASTSSGVATSVGVPAVTGQWYDLRIEAEFYGTPLRAVRRFYLDDVLSRQFDTSVWHPPPDPDYSPYVSLAALSPTLGREAQTVEWDYASYTTEPLPGTTIPPAPIPAGDCGATKAP